MERQKTIKEINNLINEEKKRNEEENKAARQEFEKEMKAITMEGSKKTAKNKNNQELDKVKKSARAKRDNVVNKYRNKVKKIQEKYGENCLKIEAELKQQ